MRMRSPSSRGFFRPNVSIFDVFLALISPLLALYLRGAYILTYDEIPTVGLYCLISMSCSVMAFLMFRLHDGVARFFSVHDALDVVKAVVSAELMTSLVLFTFTRLDGIPRSTLVIHALTLGAGLLSVRTFMRMMYEADPEQIANRKHPAAEHIIMVGSNRLSALYIKLLEAYSRNRGRVIAVVDDRPEMVGRTISGVKILGATDHLLPIIDEFAMHGIRTDRIIFGGDSDLVPQETLAQINQICAQRKIKLDFIPRIIGLNDLVSSCEVPINQLERTMPEVTIPTYFQVKRAIDFLGALVLLLILSPLYLCVGILTILDVGSPVLFWQQRLGVGGSTFLLYKFRTLRPPFDWHGRPLREYERISSIGQLLRAARLDELPQLLNVLVGDMSLIGPRPLLPRDQPENSKIRLMVRPGITGWAQVNGAKLLTPEEKEALDDWYIRNASFWLDLRIVFMTLQFVLRSARKSQEFGC